LSPRQMLLGEEIIGNIDENGYLTCSIEDVVNGLNQWVRENGDAWFDPNESRHEFTPAEAEDLLRVIQSMDPPGIGARNLRECLLLQLRDQQAEDTLTYKIIHDYFDQLINHRWSEISKELSITPKDVQTAADEVAKLDPKPG